MKCFKIRKYDILNNINLELNENGIVFIMGKSGAGKTTLFRILSGIDNDYSGNVDYDESLNKKPLDYYRKNILGVIFQDYNLIDTLDVKDNILLGAKIAGKNYSEDQYNSIVELLDIKNIENRTIDFLSGGEKQRVAIARALLRDDRIIFADEPSGSIDEKNTKRLFDYIKKQSAERLFVVITHDKQIAEEYGDRIIEISDGSIISDIKKRTTSPLSIENTAEKKKWSWKLRYSLKNFLKRKRKYLGISLIATFAMCCIMLILGFVGSARNIYYDMDSSGMENDKYVLYKRDDSGNMILFTENDIDYIRNIKNTGEEVFFYKSWLNIRCDGDSKTIGAQVYKEDSFFKNRFKDIEGEFKAGTYNIVIDEKLADELFGGSREAVGKSVELFSDIKNIYKTTIVGVKNTTSDEEAELFISEELAEKVYSDNYAFGVNIFKDDYNNCVSLVFTDVYKDEKVLVGRAPENANEIAISAALINSIKTEILNDNNLLASSDLTDKSRLEKIKDQIIGLKLKLEVCTSMTTMGEKTITGVIHNTDEGIVYLNNELMNPVYYNMCNVYLKKTDEASKNEFESALKSNNISYDRWSAGKGLSISVRVSTIADLLGIVAVIISVFSAVVLHFFVKETINERKYETGVLRSLGCTKKDLFMLLLNEEIILGCVICIFTTVLFGVFNTLNIFDRFIINGVNIYSFRMFHLLIIVGVTLLLFVIFSIPEIVKAVKSNIVKMLNEK